MQPADNIKQLQSVIPRGVTLVAVSKFHPDNAIMQAYNAGQRIFGESRAQELIAKASALPSDIQWHFIGHLQTNKVKAVLPIVSLIHSIDSERLLRAVGMEAIKIHKTVDVLLQVHVAAESTKTGFTPEELTAIAPVAASTAGISVRGIMGMATNTTDTQRITADFRSIRQCYDTLAATTFAADPHFNIISMGMSDDWQLALAAGSNMVRIGSAIFGQRTPIN